jgi:hypothetical protein
MLIARKMFLSSNDLPRVSRSSELVQTFLASQDVYHESKMFLRGRMFLASQDVPS